MNAAQMAREGKAKHPEDYCPAKGCLWRVRTRNGVKPCPKHQARTEGLAPETVELMETLVTSLRADQGLVPVLTGGELELIRAKVAAGTFDALDAGALLDHIDYVTDAYEQIVQRSAQDNDRTHALVLAKDEEIERLTVLCRQLMGYQQQCERLRKELTDARGEVNALAEIAARVAARSIT
jgi:hypothetical protein